MDREFDELPSVDEDLLIAILHNTSDNADERMALLIEARVYDACNIGRQAAQSRAANHLLRSEYLEDIKTVLQRWLASLKERANATKNSDAA